MILDICGSLPRRNKNCIGERLGGVSFACVLSEVFLRARPVANENFFLWARHTGRGKGKRGGWTIMKGQTPGTGGSALSPGREGRAGAPHDGMTGRGSGAVCRGAGHDRSGRAGTPVPCDTASLSPLEKCSAKSTDCTMKGATRRRRRIYGQQQTQLPVWPRWSRPWAGPRAALVGTGGSIAQAAAPAKRYLSRVNGEFGCEPQPAGSQGMRQGGL